MNPDEPGAPPTQEDLDPERSGPDQRPPSEEEGFIPYFKTGKRSEREAGSPERTASAAGESVAAGGAATSRDASPGAAAVVAPADPGAAEESGLEAAAATESAEALPAWSELSLARRQAIVEALLFASEQPLSLKDMREILGAPRNELVQLIGRIREDLSQHSRGLTLEEVAGGFVFRTRLELAPWLRALVKTRPPRLSRAALECLAIVAYRQPVTRAEVEEVRGVESGQVLRTLLEKRLVRILGRKEDVGRPMIYGTTREFLQMFGLKDLTGLPTLRDLNALMGRSQGPSPQGADEEKALETPRGRIGPAFVKPIELPDEVQDD